MVLNNQNKPEKEKEKKWSLVPEEVICPFCKKQIKTNVKEEFNWGTCMLYIAMIPLFLFFAWLGCADASCCKSEPCCKCCYDGTHFCPNCEKEIGIHKSSNC